MLADAALFKVALPLTKQKNRRIFLATIGPGILIAATGVGAGDLAAGAFAGSKLSVAVLWAVLLDAFIKYVITEGLARWQLATGQTLLEGAIYRLGRPAQYFFISYFLVWTLGVGSSLISACGVAAYALFPFFDDPEQGKIVFGIIGVLRWKTEVGSTIPRLESTNSTCAFLGKRFKSKNRRPKIRLQSRSSEFARRSVRDLVLRLPRNLSARLYVEHDSIHHFADLGGI